MPDVKEYIPYWKRVKEPPPVTPTVTEERPLAGKPLSMNELLANTESLLSSLGATDKVTPPQPEAPILEAETEPGTTTRYLSREEYKLLGLDPDVFLREVSPPEESLYQKIEKYPVAAATTPLFEAGGIPISAGDLVALGLIAFGAYQGARALPALFKEVGDKTLGMALNTGLDKWIAQRSRGVPAQRFKALQDVLYNQIVKNKTWLQEKATENMLSRMGRGVNKTQAANQAVENAIKDFENELLPALTATNTAVPGQKFSMSEIIGGLTSKKPVSVQAVSGVRAELIPEKPPAPEVTNKVIGRTPRGEANLLQTPDGIILERIATGKQKGWWKTIVGETEVVGKTPERVVKIAQDRGLLLPKGEAITPEVPVTEAGQLEAEIATAPIESVTPAEVAGKGIPEQPPPPPPETGITSEPPPVEPSGKISFAPLQDIQTVIDYSTKPDVSRWIANLPVVKQVMSKVNPSAIADTPAKKFVIGRVVLREEGIQKAQGIVSYLGEMGNQAKIFGKLDDNGLIASGKLKGLSVNDIRTYPKKYADRLTPEQKKWIERAHDIEEAKLKYLRDNDIDVNELTFEEGGEYAGRRVFAKISSDGEILDTTYIGAGPTRVGKKASFEKPRSYATAKEAIADGYKYIPDDEALALNVRAAYNRVADKKASDWLLTQVSWRTNGAPEELVLAAESAKIRLNSSRQLIAALNRAVRGERVPDATLNSIARTYPDEATELKRLIPQIQAGEPTAEDVQALAKKAKALERADNKAKWAAVNARARAREKAMAPKIGEAMVMHPAFSGKIFTGTEAKELAETLRRSLDPGMSQALAAVNKVNALIRYFKLAGDFSPLAIQLIFLLGSNPRIYGGAAASMPKILLDSTWQDRFLAEHKAVIDRHPGLLLSTAGTEFTEAMAKGGMLSTRINIWPKQEATLKKLGLLPPRAVGKAGATVLQPFQRVFEGTLDYAGIKMAEALEHLAKTPAEMAEVDQFINEFRGLTSSAKLGVSPNWRATETATLLAPRYNRAIAALLVDAGKGAVSFGQSGIRNRLAIQGLIKGIAAISAVAVAISWARGEDWDEITEHFDPLSPKFFTWNVAGQNIGPGSKVRSVVKLVAQSIDNPESLWQLGMENPVLRFIRGNLAPVLGSTVDILTGRNYIGDPVRKDAMNFTEEVLVKQFLPIWVENVVYEGGNLSQRLIRGAGEFFGGRAYPETTSDALDRLYERYAAKEYGKKAEELNKLERSALEDKYTDLAEAKAENEKYWSERGDDIGIALDIEQQRLEDAMNKSLDEAAQKLLAGEMSKYDYDKNRSYIRPYTSGGKSALWSLRETLQPYEMKQYEKWYAENTKPEDKAYDDYQEFRATLIEKAELPLDWDAIERELESYLNKYPQKTREYISKRQDEWIKNLPSAAHQVELQRADGIEDETWWKNYREAKKPGVTPSNRPSGEYKPYWQK